MEKTNRNHSIQCTVDVCKHHCDNADYCSLSQIKIGTHENNPKEVKCTDCESFQTLR